MEIDVEEDPVGAARRLQERVEEIRRKAEEKERRRPVRSHSAPDPDRLPYKDPD